MDPSIRIRKAGDEPALVPALAEVLLDCIAGGASVSFMSAFSREQAAAFWTGVIRSVARGERILLVAEDESGCLMGTVQVVLDLPENQPHRGDVCKMLVHRSARRKGLGAALMRAAESAAREAGRSLLVLDTVTGGDGERLYQSLGWQRVGDIPNYAQFPDGRPCSTTYYYKRIS